MKLSDFEFKKTTAPAGVQILLDFGSYELSIVNNEVSYGNAQGLYEIAVFEDVDQVELPGITEDGDTVKGWLTESDVDAIITKLFYATGNQPQQL